MRREFNSHLEAINWIAENAETESHFEILREELTFNHIHTGEYFINSMNFEAEVVWLDDKF